MSKELLADSQYVLDEIRRIEELRLRKQQSFSLTIENSGLFCDQESQDNQDDRDNEDNQDQENTPLDDLPDFRGNIHYLPNVTRQSGPNPAHRFWNIVSRTDSEPVELITGLVSLAWGIWLLNPIVDSFAAAPAIYSGLSALAPEWSWGFVAILLGAIQLGAMLYARYDLRKLIAFSGFFMWAFVGAASLADVSAATTAPVAYPMMAMLCGWTFLRVKQERN